MARPKMPMGGMNMNAMLRQAQKMQADIENAKTELDAREYEFSAGGGAVSVKMNGKHELVGISIRTAVNGALAAAKEDESKTLVRFSGAMGGLL